MGRDRIGEIAGGSTGNGIEPELYRFRDSDGHNTVLVGKGRMIDRVILHIQFFHTQVGGQAVGFDEWRKPTMQADTWLSIDRKKFAVTPERLRTRFDHTTAE